MPTNYSLSDRQMVVGGKPVRQTGSVWISNTSLRPMVYLGRVEAACSHFLWLKQALHSHGIHDSGTATEKC